MNATSTGPNRLCIVTPVHSANVVGGAEYQIDCLIDVLSSRHNHQIYYLSGVIEDGVDSGKYRVIRVGNESRAPRLGYIAQGPSLYRALSEIRPAVIYQRVACGYTGVCAYYSRNSGARLVWHVAHNSDVTPRESLDGRNPVRRFLEKRSVEYAIRRASCIITQTADQAALLERNYRRRADAIIPNFHPLPRETIDKSGPITVTWVAGLKPWKRPEVFVDLAESLRNLPQVRFVMVGPNSSAGRPTAQGELLQRVLRTPNLQYLGGRSQSEVNELLARSHVFVNTSRHEGFPNTFIQAWMREVPVVSLHVDPDRLLENRGIGIFCHDSETQLADAVRRLITDEALRKQYAAKAREYSITRHSLANATGLAELLETGGATA